jgi:hypothetical protein
MFWKKQRLRLKYRISKSIRANDRLLVFIGASVPS